MYSPYDFNQAIAHRAEYVEERLKSGAPVVALSTTEGALLVSLKRTQRKVYEIYDQIMFSAIGNQADIESVRLASIDFCHQEGFSRSPDDVSLQRLVGFVLSPPLKRAFGDPMTTPNVLRAVFSELGETPDKDQFFVLNYDGEFTTHTGFALAGGSDASEEAMRDVLTGCSPLPGLEEAVGRAKDALRAGLNTRLDDDHQTRDALAEFLEIGVLEAAVLERNTERESKFRLLSL